MSVLASALLYLALAIVVSVVLFSVVISWLMWSQIRRQRIPGRR